MKGISCRVKLTRAAVLVWIALLVSGPVVGARNFDENPYDVLEWNQIFIDMLIATNAANASSPRLGAIVHTAIFDAYNGIDRRYTPIFVNNEAPDCASRRAAVIAAAYTALASLFPSQKPALDTSYAASLAALTDNCDDADQGSRRRGSCARRIERIERGIAWGTDVAQAVLAWRGTDGFSASYVPFNGGTAVGQWRPTPPLFGPMSSQGLAFTAMFVLDNSTQYRPGPPRALTSPTYTDDFNAVKVLGRDTGSARTVDQTALAPFWDGNASIHWNQAANQMARANHLSMSDSNRLLAVLNIAMADTMSTTWSAKRFYGDVSFEVTWRPVTSIALADTDGNPHTLPEPGWLPLINTPSHPEYPAGHPSLNGAAATVLLSYFRRQQQTFTLTTTGQPSRTYNSIAQARSDGNNARVWGGMHYPSTVAISDAAGEAIANYVNRHSMQRRHPQR
jgi:PAP2 superfamily